MRIIIIPVLLLALVATACGSGGFGIKSELVTEARFPVTLAFAPDGRLFYNELKSGNIRVIDAEGELLPEPFAVIENLAGAGTNWGLIGLAIDPQFETNHYVYIQYMEKVQPKPRTARPIVIRFTDVDNRGAEPTIILDDLPETDPGHPVGAHAAGNLHFGPDGFLYLSIGDMQVDPDARDLSILRGKIIRFSKADGSAPPDNPFVQDRSADPRIFAYGFRNPFDFAFHPSTGRLYAADNGSWKCDKLVIVEEGNNYGWPGLKTFCAGEGPTVPLYLYAVPDMEGTDTGSNVGPTGLQFVSSDLYPSLSDSLLACEWLTGFMRALVLGGDNQNEVLSDDVVAEDCQLDIAVSPDGIIYYTSSNLRGEGEIRRLVPE